MKRLLVEATGQGGVVVLDVADPLMWFCRVNGGTDRRWGQHTYDIGDYDIPEEFRTPSTPTKNVIPNVAALMVNSMSVRAGRGRRLVMAALMVGSRGIVEGGADGGRRGG